MQEQIMNNGPQGPETADADAPDPARVRALNDAFRQSFIGGRIVMTAGVGALPDRVRDAVIAAVRSFDAFDPDNDPYGEHDLGTFTVEGRGVLFKVDCYDRSMRLSSPDATDPAVTVRVMTIMLAEEY